MAAISDDEEVPEDFAPAIVAESTMSLQDHVGGVGRRRTRYQGQSRLCVSQCRERPREHRLSPFGRQYRLDRHVGCVDGQRLVQELPDGLRAAGLGSGHGTRKGCEKHGPQRSDRGFGDPAGLEGELQEAAAADAFGEGGRHHRPAGARDFRHDPAARAAGLDRRRQRHRHPARQARRREAHHRRVRPARDAGRFRGAGRPAGRSRVPAAGARGRRRRSPEGAVAHRPRAARRRYGRQDPRHQGRQRDPRASCRRRRPRTPPERRKAEMQKGGSAALRRPMSVRVRSDAMRQWIATGTRSFSKAPAIARSRWSDSRIG